MEISKQISKAFQIGNLIATILVVAIHCNSMKEINSLDCNYYFQQFLTNGIARVAVPFFAFASGFFLLAKMRESYVGVIKSRINSIILPYFFCLTIIFILYSAVKYLLVHENVELIKYFKTLISPSISRQYWYLRDLIVLIGLSPIIFKFNKTNYLFGFSIFILWLIDVQIFPRIGAYYLINVETLLFFYLGGLLRASHFDFTKILARVTNIEMLVLITIYFLIISIRIYIDPSVDVWYVKNYNYFGLILYKTSICVGLPLLMIVSIKLYKIDYLIKLSSFTFFVYLFHYFPFLLFANHFIKGQGSFYVKFPLITVLTFTSGIILSSIVPSLYKVLTGNRNLKNEMPIHAMGPKKNGVNRS